jgi:competence protein ComEC
VAVGEKVKITGHSVASREVRSAALIFANEIKVIAKAKPIFAVTEKIRERFRIEASRISGDAGALIPGLVIGDTKLESEKFIGQMRRVGLTHLTAVSGENFAIIAAFLAWLLRRIIPKLKTRLIITGVVLTLFIFLVRPSPSVARAGVMTAIALIAAAKGLRVKAITSLGAAIAILILIDPFQAIDPGFALSVGATAGIILISPKLPMPEPLAIPVAATIMCTPVIIAISGTLSLVSIPANILASPLVAPITILGFIAALFPPVAPILLTLISPLAKALAFIAHFGAGFPVLKLPKSFLGAFIVLAVIILLRFNYKIAAAILIPTAFFYLVINSQFPGKNWEVVNCDVGQGDGLVINLGSGQGIVIDAGPDEKLIDSCLIKLGINSIPLLVLTHFHADHVGGLAGAINNRQVGQVWLTSYTAPFIEREITLKALRGQKEYFPIIGNHVEFKSNKGEVKIEVLWPRQSFDSYRTLPGDGSSINNSSIALLITVNKLRIFATGDIEPPVQEEIYRANNLTQVDILKVPHHGSAYQYPPLLTRVHPKISLISVGLGNRYGHPAARTISLLESLGSRVMRTDKDGAISVDPSLSIRTKKTDWWDISWG